MLRPGKRISVNLSKELNRHLLNSIDIPYSTYIMHNNFVCIYYLTYDRQAIVLLFMRPTEISMYIQELIAQKPQLPIARGPGGPKNRRAKEAAMRSGHGTLRFWKPSRMVFKSSQLLCKAW